MALLEAHEIFRNSQKVASLIVLTVLLLVSATVGVDFLFARFHNSSFYISESLLFSSYWLLFLPLLKIQWKLVKELRKTSIALLIVILSTAVHLLCYPAMVWFISKSFYYHTFSYWQTFDYGITDYFIKTLVIYSLSLLILTVYKAKSSAPLIAAKEMEHPRRQFITSMIVSDSTNGKIAIETNDILYFSANPPYVNVHHKSKKYLHTGTLKALENQLNRDQFIRIHKSYIVNISKVVSYESRLNGDYDLTLTDSVTLRVSRNFAAGFKKRFGECPRLDTK